MTVEAPVTARPGPRAGHRHSRARPKPRLPGWLTVVLWIVVAPLALVALMRVVAWDRFDVFALANTLSAFIYLPAWIVAGVALVGRRWVLGGVAVVVVALQLVFVLPELTAAQPLPSWAASAPTFRLMDGNVYDLNPNMSGYAAQIKQTRPQVLALEEAIPTDVTQLEHAGALAGLPYRIQIKRYDPRAFLVASAYPLLHTHVVYFWGRPLIVQTTIALPSGNQALWVVHTVAPLPSSFDEWKAELAYIGGLVRARGSAGLLVAGDFNATWGNKGFHTILDTGVVDGSAARGRAFDMTWSQIEHPVPPVVRIDHVLTGAGVAVTSIASAPGPGSDHRDLHAVIAVRPWRTPG